MTSFFKIYLFINELIFFLLSSILTKLEKFNFSLTSMVSKHLSKSFSLLT